MGLKTAAGETYNVIRTEGEKGSQGQRLVQGPKDE